MLSLHTTRVLVGFGAIACLAVSVAAQCPPAEPGGMAASNGSQCNGVLIDWNAVSGATYYEVWRSTSSGSNGVHLVDTPATQFTDITAFPGNSQHYWYRVRAFRAACLPGNNLGPFAGPNEGWRGDSPGTPQDVQASDGEHCTHIQVTWDAVSGVPEYKVYRSNTDQFSSAVQVFSTTLTSFSDTTVPPNTTHHYWVRAVSPCGVSDVSDPDVGTRGAPTPTDLEATPQCPGVVVSWSVPGGVPTQVYMNLTDEFETAVLLGTTLDPFWHHLAASSQSTYYYWVRTQTLCGASELAGPVTGVGAGVLAAPENVALSVHPSICDAAIITWDAAAGVPPVQLYRIYASTANVSIGASQVGTVLAPLTSDELFNFTPGTTYYFWVKAENACGEGPGGIQGTPFQLSVDPISVGQQPTSQAVYSGQSATFSVSASGAVTLQYRWRYNGVPLVNFGVVSGAFSPELTIDPVAPVHAGEYDVQISDGCHTVISNPATLTVLCYADCNADGALTVADFGCFQTKFVLGDPYADCDESGSHTVADFGCFQTKFVVGCP